MKYRSLLPIEVTAVVATLKALPPVASSSVGIPTGVRIYGPFIPAIKAMRSNGYSNKDIATAIFTQSRGRVGPTWTGAFARAHGWEGTLHEGLAAQYISTAINYKGKVK